jgi:hypothetical protein
MWTCMISFAIAPAMKPIMMYQMICNIGVRGSGYGKWNVDMCARGLPVRAISERSQPTLQGIAGSTESHKVARGDASTRSRRNLFHMGSLCKQTFPQRKRPMVLKDNGRSAFNSCKNNAI